MRLPKMRYTIGGLMVTIAYLAIGFAFPWLFADTLIGLTMMVGSVAAATLLASPFLVLSWFLGPVRAPARSKGQPREAQTCDSRDIDSPFGG